MRVLIVLHIYIVPTIPASNDKHTPLRLLIQEKIKEHCKDMFFFIASVQPTVQRVLERHSGNCLLCGSRNFDRVELSETLKLFFIPVWSWSPKEVLLCHDCGFQTTKADYLYHQQQRQLLQRQVDRHAATTTGASSMCSNCGARLDSSQWRYCPQCGVPV